MFRLVIEHPESGGAPDMFDPDPDVFRRAAAEISRSCFGS